MKNKKVIEEGTVFGELTVIGEDKKGRIRCECSCGKPCTYEKGKLLNGIIGCCGHTFGGINRKNALKVGKFEKLTVIAPDKEDKTKLHCVCDCGNEVFVRFTSLFLKSETSCKDCKDNRTHSMKVVDVAVENVFRKDMLVAESRDNTRTTRQKAFINMRCDCGNLKSFEYKGLLKLEYGSCGCYKPKEVKPSPAVQKALTTKTFSFLDVLRWEGSDARYVVCKCKCGTERFIRADSLLSGDTTSCGCRARTLAKERLKGRFNPESVTKHPLYYRYTSMFKRCYNENNTDYQHYGERGITVCERWTSPPRDCSGFYNFLEDMESSYFEGSEIERLDVNGNYEPSNCTWICRRSQINNIRRNRKLKGFGVELNVAEWGHLLNFNCKMLDDRINKLKWDDDNLESLLESVFRD